MKLIQNIILIIHQHGFNFIDAKMDGGECQKGSEGTGQNDIDKVKLMSNDPVPSDMNQIVSYTYDSWGKIVSIKDEDGRDITDQNHVGIVNPYRYRSYRYDEETELYYLNSRYYNPEWGRFLNADGIIFDIGANILGHNLYAYCANNPVNGIDYNGEAVQLIPLVIPLILGAIPEDAWESAAQGLGDLISAVIETGKNTVSNIKKKFSSAPIKTQSHFPRNHTVYTLRDIDNTVQYVGRTVNYIKRRKAHQANPARAGLSFNIEQTNLTRSKRVGAISDNSFFNIE